MWREVKKTQIKKSLKDSGDGSERKLQLPIAEPVKEQDEQQAIENITASELPPKSLADPLG